MPSMPSMRLPTIATAIAFSLCLGACDNKSTSSAEPTDDPIYDPYVPPADSDAIVSDTVAAVAFIPAGGTYTSAQTIHLATSTTGAEIRYTTDGTLPTAWSPLYAAPLTVDASTTIMAIAVKPGMTASVIATAAYAIVPTTPTGPTHVPAWNTTIAYGSMTDLRDGQTYRTVTIGSQTWMAQNLNYATDSSWCIGASADSCAKYGRLYNWSAAMNIGAQYDKCAWGGSGRAVRGACPTGWHVPNDTEWTILTDAVGGAETKALDLMSYGGWTELYNKGTDVYGFRVLPGDLRYNGETNLTALQHGYFWTAKEAQVAYSWTRQFTAGVKQVSRDTYMKKQGLSLRCLMDTPTMQTGSDIPWNEAIVYGSMVDPRDNQTYRTVTIGTQVWMAQNLNYKTPYSWCYDTSDAACANYGRLYNWAAAVGADQSYLNASWVEPATARGVCPTGWHVPSNAEMVTLQTAAGGKAAAGSSLRGVRTWLDAGTDGTDLYGFRALVAGYRGKDSTFKTLGQNAYFWTATDTLAATVAMRWSLSSTSSPAFQAQDAYKSEAYSVRCLQD